MNEIRLSIILPCYNVENYISECFDSLFAQDISENEFEIICVNDCSTDLTREIILEYQKQHKNIVLIDNQVNKQQGETRNIGLRSAKGKYIWFIDSDDFIEKNCFASLLNIMEVNELEVLNFEMKRFFQWEIPEKQFIPFFPFDKTEIISGKNFLISLNDFSANGAPVRRIYKKSYLIINNFNFTQTGYNEDQIFSLKTVYFAEKFKHIKQNVYFYRANPTSTQNTAMNVEKYFSLFVVATELIDFQHNIEKIDLDFSKKIRNKAFEYLNAASDGIFFFDCKKRKKLAKLLKPYLPEIQYNNYFSGIKKLYFIHFNFSNKILYIASPVLRLFRNSKIYLKNIIKNLKLTIKRITLQK